MADRHSFWGRAARCVAAGALVASAFAVMAQDGPAALKARHAELADQLAQSPFKRPLLLESADEKGRLRGDIDAVMNHPFAEAAAVLADPSQWCEILFLHINTKYCKASGRGTGATLVVVIGRKTGQPLRDAHRAEFAWRQVAASPDFLDVQLEAPDGPLGTSNYRIALQAVPIDGKRTFLRLRYAYDYGVAGSVAMRAYLATAGRSKVGFTSVGRDASGVAQPIAGMRGVIERNAMRYYLAIDTRLSVPPGPGALDRRLTHWFNATEQYPRQLHELEWDEYLRMKRAEYERQQQPF